MIPAPPEPVHPPAFVRRRSRRRRCPVSLVVPEGHSATVMFAAAITTNARFGISRRVPYFTPRGGHHDARPTRSPAARVAPASRPAG